MQLSTPFHKGHRNHRITRTSASVAALILGSTLLTACGGVTIEGDSGSTETTTSIARETAPETAGEETTRESSTSSPRGGNAPAPRDQPAVEMTEAPSTKVERSPEELDLLDGLREGGIDVEGVEDPLIATAGTVCRSLDGGGDNVTVDAIAGQLITQQRVDVPEGRSGEVADLIRETAERTYC